ncbi:hypothetical protein [Methylomonas rosea]|uniref:Uncharacterized protein n=1 Tax=Methylomonas rosea TaxID=2952227 RepID=A0ABT1TND1_9GAMM|nr:hypothetical protein [Methylomonas sp. WSC-7]MCQ8116108.1 hypothetical protein [Methylomonas sp. WSC-7]
MKEIWIVAANSAEYGRVYLPDYAGVIRQEVATKVMDGAHRERFRGTLDERLKMLGWEIVKVGLIEIQPR